MKSKFKIGVPVILIAVALGLILPNPANALLFGLLDDIGRGIFSVLGEIVQSCLTKLLTVSASLFEVVLGWGFDKGTAQIIKVGWTACKDFTNMLFILFMVIIAFGTILRIERYGVKNLLPKIIIIALLINFSFVLCSVIVDFSNITADFFIKDIKGKISTPSGEKGAITAVFADAFNITGTHITVTNCDDVYKGFASNCKGDTDCIENAIEILNECKKDQGIKVQITDETFLDIFFGIILGSIIMILAIFTFVSGALMILFRIIAIWFLITIVPLAFICYALPGLQDNWKKWWSKFLHWCIFAPAYAFFVWIAIQIAVTQANKKIGMIASKYAIPGNFTATANAFQNNPGGELISYFIIIGFLVAALVVAQNLGIYGANAAMSIATKAKTGAANWMKRQAMRPVAAGGSMIGAGALGLTGRLFGGRIGGRMQAKATQIRQARMQTVDNKNFAALAKTLLDKDLLNEIEKGTGPRKLIAVQEAISRRLLNRTTNRKAARIAHESLIGYGFAKEAKDLRDARIDIVADPNIPVGEEDKKLRIEVDKVTSKGEQGAWRDVVFEPEEGKKIIQAIIDSCDGNTHDFAAKFGKLNGLAQLKALARMTELFTDNFDETTKEGKENINIRRMYAAVTGEANNAFRNPVIENGKAKTNAAGWVEFEPVINKGANVKLGEYVKTMRPIEFSKLDPRSVKDIAEHVDAAMAVEIGRYISGDMKKEFAKTYNKISGPEGEKIREILRKSSGWTQYITPPPQPPKEEPPKNKAGFV